MEGKGDFVEKEKQAGAKVWNIRTDLHTYIPTGGRKSVRNKLEEVWGSQNGQLLSDELE